MKHKTFLLVLQILISLIHRKNDAHIQNNYRLILMIISDPLGDLEIKHTLSVRPA